MKTKTLWLILLGLALLLTVVRLVGPRNAWTHLQSLRLCLPLLILIGLARLGLQTWNWSIALNADGITVRPARLVGARLASQSLSYLSAMGPVVSEPMKLMLLRGPRGVAASAPATLAETAIYWFTSVLFGLAGTCAGAMALSGASRSVGLLWLSGVVFAVALPLLLAKRSILSRLGRHFRNVPSWLRRAGDIEDQIRSFRTRHSKAARRIFALDLVSQILMLAEVMAVLWAVGIHTGFLTVLAIEAATRAVKVIGVWLPGRIGADEGGATGAFLLFGLNPGAGLTLALSRRVRDLLWCAAGLVWLACSAGRTPATSSEPVCGSERTRNHASTCCAA